MMTESLVMLNIHHSTHFYNSFFIHFSQFPPKKSWNPLQLYEIKFYNFFRFYTFPRIKFPLIINVLTI